MTTETVPTISRTYRGKQGMKDFQEDAAKLAGHGYLISSQVQTPGQRTAAASVFIVLGVFMMVVGLFLLPLILVGIVLLIIGLVSGKSPDELAVVWHLPAAPVQAPTGASPTPINPYEAIDALAALRDKGAIPQRSTRPRRPSCSVGYSGRAGRPVRGVRGTSQPRLPDGSIANVGGKRRRDVRCPAVGALADRSLEPTAATVPSGPIAGFGPGHVWAVPGSRSRLV